MKRELSGPAQMHSLIYYFHLMCLPLELGRSDNIEFTIGSFYFRVTWFLPSPVKPSTLSSKRSGDSEEGTALFQNLDVSAVKRVFGLSAPQISLHI